MIQGTHLTNAMRIYITNVCRLGIEFSRAATLYYSRSAFRRILEAVTKPPQLGIELRKTAITEAVTQIEKERDTLNAKRLYEVQQSVEKVRGASTVLSRGLQVSSTI